MSFPAFDKGPSLKYLGLPEDYSPAPESDPVAFLSRHLTQLPPHLLLHYSWITTPKQRTVLAPIRNRRMHYADKNPPELTFDAGRSTWPHLWEGRSERRGLQEGKEERAWAATDFLHGMKQHLGKLGDLLAEYEEEREAERLRILGRSGPPVKDDFVPEEDSDSDEENSAVPTEPDPQETEEEAKASFERLLRERFIYGLLDNIDYDQADWDEALGNGEDREAEERWFDDDDDDDE